MITDFDLEIPEDVLKSEIVNQFNNNTTMFNSKDLIEIFNTKLKVNEASYNDEYYEDEVDITEISGIRETEFDDFCCKLIKESMGIEFDRNNLLFDRENIHTIYNIFITHMYVILVDFFTIYIINNKNNLAEPFDTNNTANITVKTIRKQYKNKIDSLIIINLYRIMTNLIEADIVEPEIFIELTYNSNTSNFLLYTLKSLYDNCITLFDIGKFKKFVNRRYLANPMILTSIKQEVLQRLMAIFPEKMETSEVNTTVDIPQHINI